MSNYSAVLVVPAALLAEGNAIGEALGWGPGNFSVPLSTNGLEPATHYGLHAQAQQNFVDMFTGAAQGVVPDGLDPAALPVIGAMASSSAVEGVKRPAEHFQELLDAAGLRRLGDVVEDG